MRTRSSTSKRLLKLIVGISAMTLCAAPSSFAVFPNTEFLPTFQVETLTPLSQAALAWRNVAPNALASYYTFKPFTTADAALVGFPTVATVTASNPYGLICGDSTNPLSTADCYIITARQVAQPMSLDFLRNPTVATTPLSLSLFPGPGLIQGDGVTPFYDANTLTGTATTAYGYGSGGAGWKPYGATGPAVAFGNAPATFQNTPISVFTPGSNIFGDPAAKGIWHFPAPSIKATSNRPVLVQWLNELPNVKPTNLDVSGDCGDNAPFCYPYNRMVVHVHGAHVGPESDGLAVSWYTPNYAVKGEGSFPTLNYTMSTNAFSPKVPISYYPNTQEAATVWYHDHAIGTTHNNVNMGLAGFFPLTDNVEKCLQGTVTGLCTAPTKILPTGDAYELGFALQDRNFDVNGQMVTPEAAIYDKNDPNCVFDINNNALPGTCKRLGWMKQIGPITVTDPQPAAHLIPYVLGAPELTVGNASYALNNPPNCKTNIDNVFEGVAGVDPVSGARTTFIQCAPFPATSSTLEYFGNMPVVNGVTYAKYNVDPTVYRMRFIGGSDSRSYIAQLVKQGAVPGISLAPSMMNCGGGAAPAGCAVYDPTAIVPFFQVGSEQGLLTNMVQRNELDIMDGERVDVLVDFTGLGGTTVTMKNLADDNPYSGRFNFDNIATRMPTSVLVPEIMKFVVSNSTVTSGVPTPVNGKLLRAAYPAVNQATIRTIALIEITDQYGRTMPTIDARGYVPPGIRTTEVIALGVPEQWDIVNTTVDAHPMHLHQVAFQAINRQAIALTPGAVGGNTAAPSGFMAGANFTFGAELTKNTTTAARQASVFSPSQYLNAPGSVAIPVATYDAGLKDTIQCPPGYVTRVKAVFDIIGDYVWHCHILSHEEHDMMRPFRVTNAAALLAPATVTVGAVANGSVTVTVLPVQTAPKQHIVQYRKVGAAFWNTNAASTSVQVIDLTLTGAGTYDFRAQFVEPAIQNIHTNTAPDSVFTAGNQATYSIVVPVAPTALTGVGTGTPAAQTYTWAALSNATSYSLYSNFDNTYTTFLASSIGCGAGTGTCTATQAKAIPFGTLVAVQIAAINSAGTGPYTVASTFTITNTTPVAPTALTGSGTGTPVAQTYTWAAVANASSYSLYNNIDNSYTAVLASAAGCGAGTGTCTATQAKAIPVGILVSVRVAAINSAGTSPYSVAANFTVTDIIPVTPALLSGFGTAVPAAQTYAWAAVANASSYTLFDNFDNSYTSVLASAAGCGAGTGTCTLNQAIAIPLGRVVSILVNAVNASGPSPWSSSAYFVIK